MRYDGHMRKRLAVITLLTMIFTQAFGAIAEITEAPSAPTFAEAYDAL
jgi:hypothetical protein